MRWPFCHCALRSRLRGAPTVLAVVLIAVLILPASAATLLPPRALADAVVAFRRGQCGSIVPTLRAQSQWHGLGGARATYLLAHCLMQTGDGAGAIAAFDAAAQRHPTLASSARLYAALLALRTGLLSVAAMRAERLLTEAPSPPVARRAKLLQAEALVRLGDGAPAKALLTDMLADAPDDATVAKAWWLLGQAAEQAGDRLAAIHAYGMAWWAVPQNVYAADALQRLRAIRRIQAPSPPAQARLERAQRFADRGLFSEAETELVHTVRAAPVAAVVGEAWYRLGLLRLGKPTAVYAFTQAARYANAARAEFFLGRALVLTGRSAEGKVAWRQLVRDHPQSEWAARALLALARAAEAEKNGSLAERWLQVLVRRYPGSSSADEARWRRGWLRFQRGRFAEAEQIFLQAATAFPVAPRASANLYWAAKARERRGGKVPESLAPVARQYPLTYYGQRSRTRLRMPAPLHLPTPPLESLQDEQAYPTYEELGALGLDQDAADEAEAKVSADSGRELRRVAGLLLSRAGDPHRSVRIAEPAAMLALYGGRPLDVGMWSLAYPRAYMSLVSAGAQASGVDPYLVWAMMREESRFDRAAVSIAGAIGLMQLLPPTASGIAGGSLSPAQLMQPALNIRLGIAYVAAMLHRFNGDVVLAVAAYNAGPVAAARFARLPRTDPDVFIESIPFSETRAYVQRVLQSYGIYRWLYP